MMEEPMVPLLPSIAAPTSTPVKPRKKSGAEKRGERSSRRRATHQYHNSEHGATFTLKSEHGGGSSELIAVVCGKLRYLYWVGGL